MIKNTNINKNSILGFRNYVVGTREDGTTNSNLPVGFIEYSDDRNQIVLYDSNLWYNPSSETLHATNISGAISGSITATNINITNDTTSTAPQYLTFVAGLGTQNLKIANVSGFVYYPSTNVLSSLGKLAIGSVGFGLAAPQSGLYISEANTVDTYTSAGVHIGQDVANSYASIGLITSSATGVPYIKFAVSSTAYDGKIEYHCGDNQMNFYVNESANKVLALKANSIDAEENLNANTGVINLISAGNSTINWYESATLRYTFGYNPTSNYAFLQDVVNARDIIKCLDGGNLQLNPYAIGDVQIGMNPSSNPSLEVKSTIIETNVDLDVQGDCSVRENFLVGTVGALTLGHPCTLLKFHTGSSGIDVNNASVFVGCGDVVADSYAFGFYAGADTGTGRSYIQTGYRYFSTGVNTTAYDLILQPNAGHVGIGNSAPSKGALHVDRSMTAASVATGAGYLTAGGGVGTWSGGAGPVSIYSARRIWAEDTIIASSDRRIKKNIIYINDHQALNIFRKIKPCNYQMKDEIIYQNRRHWGLIGDEVQSIFPEAVSTAKNHIPNIYQLCNYKEGHLIFHKEIDIEEGIFNFRIINHLENNLEVNGEKVSEYSIKLLFNTDDDISFKEDEKLFCYGYEVDDFQTVDYTAISSLSNGALQEIDRIQQTNSIKIKNLEDENSLLKMEIENIKKHLNLT